VVIIIIIIRLLLLLLFIITHLILLTIDVAANNPWGQCMGHIYTYICIIIMVYIE